MPGPEPSLRERFVGAAGCALFLREYGPPDGPPVVLLHGFPQTGLCWRGIVPALAERHRVLVPDLPGYGRSEAPLGYAPATLALTLASFLRNAGAPRAAVVGHDWGGSLAFTLAGRHPDVVERLAVINAPYRHVDYRRAWHMLAFSLPIVPELAFAAAGDRLIDLTHRVAATNKEAFADSLPEYRAAFRGVGRIRPPLAYYRNVTRHNLSRALLGRARSSGARLRIEQPTLVIWGERDPALPASLAEGIKRDIPHARVELIPHAGHFVPEEAPEHAGKLLAGFLA